MVILDVVPLSRGINKDTLSYFSSIEVEIGGVVKVPLRGRTINAIVTGSRNVSDLKQEIKSADFAIKKIESVVTERLLTGSYWKAVKKTADYHASSVGSVLYTLLPQAILENSNLLSSKESSEVDEKILHGLVLQSPDDERFRGYRSLIREEFARGRSVFLCLPTINDVRKAEEQVEKGIGDYTYVFHGKLKKKELKDSLDKLNQEKHPHLIIGTGNFLCLANSNIGLIIVDRESSRLYKNLVRPFVDTRYFAEQLARELGAKILFGDAFLRLETYWRTTNEELGEVNPLLQRIPLTTEPRVIDMRRIGKDRFQVVSPEAEDLIRNSRENNERVFIFSNRRGLSPLTLCGDCGTVVTCRNCSAPVVLHGKPDENFFMCHQCGTRRSANENCVNCAGWRLKTFGIGSELVFEKLKKSFPKISIDRLDSDTVKTHAQAEKIVKSFYESPGGVLVGTEMALAYLDQKIENVCVVSIDSLLGLPDFRVREKVFSILIRLENLAQKNFVIQTRNKGETIFEHIEKGTLTDFYREELNEREKFDYPPFTTLIKITYTGSQISADEIMRSTAEDFGNYDFNIYPSLATGGKNKMTLNGLIKIGRKRWVEPELLTKLRSLSPAFSITVDPDSIL